MPCLNAHPGGRDFLQIPRPTNVPERVLRAIDHPTIDHRGPESDVTHVGTLARLEMGLGLAGVPHRAGGVQAAIGYLRAVAHARASQAGKRRAA